MDNHISNIVKTTEYDDVLNKLIKKSVLIKPDHKAMHIWHMLTGLNAQIGNVTEVVSLPLVMNEEDMEKTIIDLHKQKREKVRDEIGKAFFYIIGLCMKDGLDCLDSIPLPSETTSSIKTQMINTYALEALLDWIIKGKIPDERIMANFYDCVSCNLGELARLSQEFGISLEEIINNNKNNLKEIHNV